MVLTNMVLSRCDIRGDAVRYTNARVASLNATPETVAALLPHYGALNDVRTVGHILGFKDFMAHNLAAVKPKVKPKGSDSIDLHEPSVSSSFFFHDPADGIIDVVRM